MEEKYYYNNDVNHKQPTKHKRLCDGIGTVSLLMLAIYLILMIMMFVFQTTLFAPLPNQDDPSSSQISTTISVTAIVFCLAVIYILLSIILSILALILIFKSKLKLRVHAIILTIFSLLFWLIFLNPFISLISGLISFIFSMIIFAYRNKTLDEPTKSDYQPIDTIQDTNSKPDKSIDRQPTRTSLY